MGVGETVVVGLCPAVVVVVSGVLSSNLLVPMLTMHLAMIILPYIRDDTNYYKQYIRTASVDRVRLYLCVVLVAGLSVSMYLGYLVLNAEVFTDNGLAEMLRKYQVDTWPVAAKVGWATYFVLLNPTIEEKFWRVFLPRVLLKGRVGLAAVPEEAQLDCILPREADPRPSGEKLLISMLYGSYHFVVVSVLVDGILYGVVGYIFVVGVGLGLFSLIEAKRCGFYVAVAAHMGLDLGTVFAIADASCK